MFMCVVPKTSEPTDRFSQNFVWKPCQSQEEVSWNDSLHFLSTHYTGSSSILPCVLDFILTMVLLKAQIFWNVAVLIGKQLLKCLDFWTRSMKIIQPYKMSTVLTWQSATSQKARSVPAFNPCQLDILFTWILALTTFLSNKRFGLVETYRR